MLGKKTKFTTYSSERKTQRRGRNRTSKTKPAWGSDKAFLMGSTRIQESPPVERDTFSPKNLARSSIGEVRGGSTGSGEFYRWKKIAAGEKKGGLLGNIWYSWRGKRTIQGVLSPPKYVEGRGRNRG